MPGERRYSRRRLGNFNVHCLGNAIPRRFLQRIIQRASNVGAGEQFPDSVTIRALPDSFDENLQQFLFRRHFVKNLRDDVSLRGWPALFFLEFFPHRLQQHPSLHCKSKV